MMGHRSRLNGDEWDAFTRWRKRLFWQPGELRRIKRQHSKRQRRLAKALTFRKRYV
jgi:anionic cell wall polymer biosynthesis LytR-Cps2A-Psr (LCP) family protein